jgi:hypothetical protein
MGDSVDKILGGIRWQAVEWIHLSQERARLVGSCVHVNESSGSII